MSRFHLFSFNHSDADSSLDNSWDKESVDTLEIITFTKKY